MAHIWCTITIPDSNGAPNSAPLLTLTCAISNKAKCATSNLRGAPLTKKLGAPPIKLKCATNSIFGKQKKYKFTKNNLQGKII